MATLSLHIVSPCKAQQPTQAELYQRRQEDRQWEREMRHERRRNNPATGAVYDGIMSMRKGD